MGLVTATLRLPTKSSDFEDQLTDAAATLLGVYGGADRRKNLGHFDVTFTCNLVLASTNQNGDLEYGVYYGSDYKEEDRTLQLSKPVVLQSLGDVSKLPTVFPLDVFKDKFEALHENSQVFIHEVVNIIYTFRRLLDNFEKDAVAPGKILRLYSNKRKR